MKLMKYLLKIVRSIYQIKRANRALYEAIDNLTDRNLDLIKENTRLRYYQGFKPLRCVKFEK